MLTTLTVSKNECAAGRAAAQKFLEAAQLEEAASTFELLLHAGDRAPEVLLSYAMTLCLLKRDAGARRFSDLGREAIDLVNPTPEQRRVLDRLATLVSDRLPGGRRHPDSVQSNLWGGT